jgi:hypothetical protein
MKKKKTSSLIMLMIGVFSYAASVVMELTYGIVPKRHDDPDIASVNACLRRLGENLVPGKWKVNTLPFMKWVIYQSSSPSFDNILLL